MPLLDACLFHSCFHVALRLPTATKTTTTTATTTTIATATNCHCCHRPLSSLAATVIDDDVDICHDNINQRNKDVDDDKCHITSTMTNDEGGGTQLGDTGGGRVHLLASAGRDGIAPRCMSTLTTSTMGKRIKCLFSLSFLRRKTTTAEAMTRTKEERGTMSELS